MSFLGIDLGTSGLRALLVDDAGAPIGEAEAGYPIAQPHAGWSEQAPGDWVVALEAAVTQLRASYPQFSEIRGIGVAGHMHGATLLDAQNAVLRPCILWNDTRSHAEACGLDALEPFRAISGNIVFPGFTAPKLEWVRRHEPDIFARVAKVLLPAAYLNYYLTGEHVGDVSDAAGTSWLDLAAREWSGTLLSHSHMRPDQMPQLVEGCAPAGVLRAEVRTRWGLGPEVVVAGGAGDNAAAACGMGVLHEGQGFVSLGTSGVLLTARDRLCAAPESALHTFCHAVPDRWYQMSVMLAAADSLSWLGSVTGRSPGELTGALGHRVRPPGRVEFAPYLSGERTPHNDATVRGGLTGLSTSTSVEDLTHAVLVGVCYGLRDGLEAMSSTGAVIETLYATGGGAASDYWLRLLATVLDTPLHLPKGRALGAALGAARLGIVATTGAPVADVMRPPVTAQIIDPDPARVAEYAEGYTRFRAMYPALKSME